MSIANIAQPLPPPGFREFRILPAGVFRTNDGSGRPVNLSGWIMNGAIAAKIIASLAMRDDVLIDYEHQSMRASESGNPAPAAGWFKRAEWREGDGLYAVDVRWTDRAAAMIRAREYRFISPVFQFNSQTGEVLGIVSVGLVNFPALSGLTDLAAASAKLPTSRDTDRAIEAFNNAFGMVGVYHPDTPAHALEALKAKHDRAVPARLKLAGVTADDAAKLRHVFPGVFE